MKKLCVSSILVLLLFTTTSIAEILTYTFDAEVEDFQNVTWQETNPVGWADTPTIQMAHTAGGWQVQMLKEFAWGPGGGSDNQQLAMQANANDPLSRIAFDVMVDGGSFTPGVATWYQLIMVGNSDGAAGWTQTQLTDSWHDADDPTLVTWHFDLPFADLGWEPGDTWFQLWMGSNSDAASTANYYVDNVVITPEPTTMVLLGLGGLLLRRRK